MNEKQFERIVQSLDTLIRLVAGNLLKEADSKTRKVEILYGFGISTKEIARLVGTTEGSVDTMKKRVRKRAKADKDKSTGGGESGEN